MPGRFEELNWALADSYLFELIFEPPRRRALVRVAPWLMPEGAPRKQIEIVPLQVVLEPVGRFAASLRIGRTERGRRPDLVEPIALDDLNRVAARFSNQDIEDHNLFDAGDEWFCTWRDALSLDWRSGDDGRSHTFDLSLDSYGGREEELDVRIWFDDVRLVRPDFSPVEAEAVIRDARRMDDSMRAKGWASKSGPVGVDWRCDPIDRSNG